MNFFKKFKSKSNDSSSRFGTCCKELQDAMTAPPNSFFRIEENGVLYLTTGYVDTENEPGFFDHAILYCPFCSSQLQTKKEIASKT